MAGRIRDEDIATVRERSPIDEVVGDYLQLRNAGGGSLKGLCPFHDEKTPSFNVTPSRGLYYCFSCAEGGDVISFVQKVDGLSFAEAVERLAARASIELRYEQGGHVPGQEQGLRRRLIAAHKAAADFYTERLRSDDAAAGREFLASRGFDLEQAEQFGVGYAPDAWEALTGHLRGRGFTDAELLTGGLAREGRRGPVDRFRGRLIWPIRDLTGDVIAFGARKLAAHDDGPKYLNTPETPLFKKSSVLYGADLAKREIAQRRQAVIVEGYTDVMACHLAGVPTAVATSGTSFGDGHIRILRRLLMDASEFRGEVIFTFDGDAAGQRAALRAFGMEDKFVTQTFVTVQPDGLDPCDLRLARGDAAVRDLIARRVPLFEFAIRSEVRQVRSRHDRGPAGGARRRRADRGADQGRGAAQAVRGRPGPLARHHGRATSCSTGSGAHAGQERATVRPGGQDSGGRPPRGQGAGMREAAAGRAAGPGRAERGGTAAAAPAGGRACLRPARPGRAGRTRGAQARRAAPGPVRAGLRGARRGRVHRAGPRRGVPADLRAQRLGR